MSCIEDKFTITKGVDNTFVFTIKPNGSTLPIEIVNNEINKETSFTPGVTYVPYQPEVLYVAPKAEVQASSGQEYIPTIEGKVEKYNIYSNSLVDNTVYEIQINSITTSIQYLEATYSDEYEYLIALKNAINANGAINTIVTATVDENILKIKGINEGAGYTVNGSTAFTITETQTAVTAVTGQSYIAPTEYSPAVAEVLHVDEVDPHYFATNAVQTIDIAELVDGLTVTKIEVQPEITIDSLEVANVSKPLVNGWYDIGTDTEFEVTPVVNNSKLEEVLPKIALRVKITLSGTVDTFSAKLINLETNEVSLEVTQSATPNGSKISIASTLNGKIELLLTEEDVAELVSEKGDKVDRYYVKPTHRMVIVCNTLNNGNFLAKIPDIYVE